MKSLRIWLLLAWLPIMGGCFPTIYSEQPLGEEIATFNPDEWDGLWLAPNGKEGTLFRLTVTDRESGILDLGGFLGERDPKFSCEPAPAVKPTQFRRSGAWYIVSETRSGLYETGLIGFREGTAWLWYWVDDDRVEALVNEGALPGRIENGKVILGSLSGAHYQVLLGETRPAVSWKPAALILKLPAALDPCKKAEPAK